MMLNVYFGGILAGTLATTADRGMVFSYDTSYLSRKTKKALSISLPLDSIEYGQKECLPFFSGLLPEGNVKRRISNYLHISETSTLKLLQELGGECAGMISILSENEKPTEVSTVSFDEKNYEFITESKLSEIIENIDTRPLLKAKEDLRLSLAGAQEKLPLAYFNNKFYLPQNGAPSTHIVKPSGVDDLSTLAINEYACMKLASFCGLKTPAVELRTIGKSTFLLEERYDRNIKKKKIERLHQEDMCQALGIMSDQKYQNDGGPSIANIYTLIYKNSEIPLLDTRDFLEYVIFNFAIGNCDAHGKNYSFLYEKGAIRLSPIYDTVCTLVYPGLTKKLSMKIGKHYEISKVNALDFADLAKQMKLKDSVFTNLLKEIKLKIENGFENIREDKSLANHQEFLDRLEKTIKNNAGNL